MLSSPPRSSRPALLLGTVAAVALVAVHLTSRPAANEVGEFMTKPHLIEDEAKLVAEDAAHCLSKDPVSSAFCRADLKEGRAEIMGLAQAALGRCDYAALPKKGPAIKLDKYVKNMKAQHDSAPWASVSPYTRQRESTWERDKEYSKVFPEADTSAGDFWSVGTAPPPVNLEFCETAAADGTWAFERIGPFTGRGHEWHSAGWMDSAKFTAKLAVGPIWVNAWGFFPTDAHGKVLGLPPIHIHHTHVASSQHLFRFDVDGEWSYDNTYAVEFDIHGDRQCTEAMGGMNCTMRLTPRGYGLKLAMPLETILDLKDVRPLGSAPMAFYGQYAFRWTAERQMPVAKMLTGIWTSSFGYFHDDYLLSFDPKTPHEYLYWSEQEFRLNASLVHMYWHAHHKYTEDMWATSASAEQLGLMEKFGSSWVDLPRLGMDTRGAQQYVRDRIAAAQDKCRTESCRYYPALRCKMNKDRWEYVGGEEAYMPRYRIPYCNRWDFLEGDVITIVSFHQLQSHVHVTQPELYWMHTAFYGFAVPTPSLHGDTSAEIPHTVDFIPSKTYEAQMGKHAGWWNTDKAISPGDHSADVRVTAYDQGYQGSKFGW